MYICAGIYINKVVKCLSHSAFEFEFFFYIISFNWKCTYACILIGMHACMRLSECMHVNTSWHLVWLKKLFFSSLETFSFSIFSGRAKYSVRMYVCILICMHVYMHVKMHINMYACIYAPFFLHRDVNMHSLCAMWTLIMHMYVYSMYMCLWVCMYVCIHVCMYRHRETLLVSRY